MQSGHKTLHMQKQWYKKATSCKKKTDLKYVVEKLVQVMMQELLPIILPNKS